MTKIIDVSQESDTNASLDDPKTRIKKFARSMLKNTLFVGEFQEKRFVESLTTYRDVIKISDNEIKFLQNLNIVKQKLIHEPSFQKIWIGITKPNIVGAPKGHCLWVKLKQEIFGKYWFNVKGVVFEDNEIRLKLDIVRPYLECSPTADVADESIPEILEHSTERFLRFIHDNVTFENFKETVKFLTVTLITLCALLMEFTKWSSEFLLKFMREFNGIIKAFTPIIQTALKSLTHLTVALFCAIVYLFKRDTHRQPNRTYTNAKFFMPRIPAIQYQPYGVQYNNPRPPYYVTEPPN